MAHAHRHGYLAARQTAISGATGTISGIPDECGDLRTGILLNNAEIWAELKFRKAAEGFSTLWRWLRSPFVDVLYLIKEVRPEVLVVLRESALLNLLSSLPEHHRMPKQKRKYRPRDKKEVDPMLTVIPEPSSDDPPFWSM